MKSLLSVLLLLVSVSSYANQAFYDYRMGDYEKAKPKLEQMGNNTLALYYLGQMALHGYAEPRDEKKAIDLISRAGKRGLIKAQLFMGRYYLSKNQEKPAFYWFLRAANQGNLTARLFIGGAYLHGYGIKPNKSVARNYYINVAKSGNRIAQYELGNYFVHSKYRRDMKLGIIWLKRSANQNYSKAQYLLAQQYALGKLVEKDQNQALYWLKRAAKNNNSEAMVELGMHYLKPPHLDSQKALDLLNKAAELGNENAYRQLANIYQLGTVTAKNEALANKWKNKLKTSKPKQVTFYDWLGKDFDKTYKLKGILTQWDNQGALEDGVKNLSPRMSTLGPEYFFTQRFDLSEPKDIEFSTFFNVLMKDNDINSNESKSIVFPRYDIDDKLSVKDVYNQAYHGSHKAQFQMAQRYEEGQGVEKNIKLAVQLYLLSAQQRNAKAQYSLGRIFLQGKLGFKDLDEALHWLNDSAIKGNPYAQYVLAQVFENGYSDDKKGEYIPKDPKFSESLYNLSASEGIGSALIKLANMYAKKSYKSVTKQKIMNKKIMKLYERAVNNGIKEGRLPLALYYVEQKAPNDKLSWAFDVATEYAKNEDPKALVLLGYMYDKGIAIEKNHTHALYWYQRALKKNNPIAKFILGTYYYQGKGIRQDKEKSLNLLHQAAMQGIPHAYHNIAMIKHENNEDFLSDLIMASNMDLHQSSLALADYYLKKANNDADVDQAAEIYEKLANLGDNKAQLKLAYLYEHGIYFNKDLKKAHFWYAKSSLQKNPVAQFQLAKMYQLGQGEKHNYKKAKQWYKKSVAQAFKPASLALGYLYETVFNDYANAVKQYSKVAQDIPDAAYNLALLYDYGKGVKKQPKKALELYKQAVRDNDKDLHYRLAQFYYQGLADKVDKKQALDWFEKAALNNHTESNYQLGLMYEAGVGSDISPLRAKNNYQAAANKGHIKAILAYARMLETEGNNDKALLLYKSAAEKGNAYAQYQVGLSYLKTPEDTANARKWLNLAAKNGFKQARDTLTKLDFVSNQKTSFIKPIQFVVREPDSKPVNLQYLQAINELNTGKVSLSKEKLNQIMKKYPGFEPAKKILKTMI